MPRPGKVYLFYFFFFVVAGLYVIIERRGQMKFFLEKIRKFWLVHQLRFLVSFSLFLQIALIFLGKLRKRNGKPWLRFLIWSAYLLADWVATVALGVILNSVQAHPKEDVLISFWAPFLLLHLGGPDTITAYSFEDNQLWQRRVLELVTQFLVAVYILFIAWPVKFFISLLTIPMLLAGVIKFGERIYSLRSASTDQFRFSQLTEPDPGPNYYMFMEEFSLKKAEGYHMKAIEIIETPLPTRNLISVENEELVVKAYDLFQTFKCLFVDLILSFQDLVESQRVFRNLDYEKAFEVIEIELGFAYDVFYTKAPAAYNQRGLIHRLITFLATLFSLVTFVIFRRIKKDKYHLADLIITYILLVVAIILEICSYLNLLFSDWSDQWVKKHYKKSIVSCSRNRFWAPRKRWSNSIAQYSIQIFNREQKSSKFPQFLKLLMAENKVDELYYLTYTGVSNDLKKLIFKHFLKISKSGNKSQFTALCTSRGKRVLDDMDCSDLNWSTTEVAFDQSILLWHIATDLCYHTIDERTESIGISTELGEEINSERTESKHMSDYMMYISALCPFMLPVGIGMIRLRDTCAEAREFFKEEQQQPKKSQACRMLLQVNTEIHPGRVKGDQSKSVLFDACRLATELLFKKDQLWTIISQVWVEILAYAAYHCRGAHHAQQLRKGGEFLTHVWLLMAHLGITEQFPISRVPKLSAK